MSCRLILLLTLFLPPLLLPTEGETVQVDGVEGQVLYGAGRDTPSVPVKVGQILPAGNFSAAANGILYLSTFSGSELRLAEAGMLHFYGVEDPCPMAPSAGRRSTFRLLGGKLWVTIRDPETPPHCYRIMLKGGDASVESGQCVMCSHGDGTYLYVARGITLLSGSVGPTAGAHLLGAPINPEAVSIAPQPHTDVLAHKPTTLTGNGNVGWLDANGGIQMNSLSAIGAAAQSCLLAGLHIDAAASGGRNPVDASRRPFTSDAGTAPAPVLHFQRFVVSPTQ